MDKTTREKLRRRLQGFAERQRQRNEQRAVRIESARRRRLENAHGTLRGARAYLTRKGVHFEETIEENTGRILLTVPRQIVLVYDAGGAFLGSGPAAERF